MSTYCRHGNVNGRCPNGCPTTPIGNVDYPSFGIQWAYGEPKDEPIGPYQAHVWDLHGRPGRDWLPLLGYVVIAGIAALVVDALYMAIG